MLYEEGGSSSEACSDLGGWVRKRVKLLLLSFPLIRLYSLHRFCKVLCWRCERAATVPAVKVQLGIGCLQNEQMHAQTYASTGIANKSQLAAAMQPISTAANIADRVKNFYTAHNDEVLLWTSLNRCAPCDSFCKMHVFFYWTLLECQFIILHALIYFLELVSSTPSRFSDELRHCDKHRWRLSQHSHQKLEAKRADATQRHCRQGCCRSEQLPQYCVQQGRITCACFSFRFW